MVLSNGVLFDLSCGSGRGVVDVSLVRGLKSGILVLTTYHCAANICITKVIVPFLAMLNLYLYNK